MKVAQNLSEFRGKHPLMSPLLAIGYRGGDRKQPEFRGKHAAKSPSMVMTGQNLECRDTSYTLSPSIGTCMGGALKTSKIKGARVL